MAVPALHTGCQLIHKQLTLANRTGRMTANAAQLLIRSQATSGGLQKIGGRCAAVADRDIQASQFAELADPAFVELALVLQDVGLPYRHARSDRIANGQR